MPFIGLICALFDFKCAYELTLVYVFHADAEKCIFVRIILSQTPWSGFNLNFLTVPQRGETAEKLNYQGRLSFHFFER